MCDVCRRMISTGTKLLIIGLLSFACCQGGVHSVQPRQEIIGDVTISPSQMTLQVNTTDTLTVNISTPFNEDVVVYFMYSPNEGIIVNASNVKIILPIDDIDVKARTTPVIQRNVTGVEVGNLRVLLNVSDTMSQSKMESPFFRVYVVHSWPVVIVNQVIGWCYFIAWSISFYPQLVLNFTTRSVVGLNFDFVLYNIIGFLSYSIFNVGFYFIPKVFDEYEEIHPGSVNPVVLNDVIFALHAVLVTGLIIIQIFCYDRGGQRVSRICLALVSLMLVFLAISLIVTLLNVLSLLTYLYFFSYCKLAITLVKYIPQAYFNFTRQSTVGWSIGNILLDFTGGSLSILQMFLQAYNNNDWNSIFGNPTKFGLGLVSILFDILFIIQHYCLYRENNADYESKRILLAAEDDEDEALLRSYPATSVESRDIY